MKHFLIFFVGVNRANQVLQGNCTHLATIFPNKKVLEDVIVRTNDFAACVVTGIMPLTKEEYAVWTGTNPIVLKEGV